MKISSKDLSIQIAAKKLFWKYGIRKVSVEEICNEAGASKMTFYRAYKNKIELAENIMIDEYEIGLQKYRLTMSQNISFEKKIKQVIENEFEAAEGLSNELLQDIYKNIPSLVTVIKNQQAISIKEVLKDFKEAQKHNKIRKDLSPDMIVFWLNNISEQLKDQNFINLFSSTQDAIVEVTKFFFYGVSTHNLD